MNYKSQAIIGSAIFHAVIILIAFIVQIKANPPIVRELIEFITIETIQPVVAERVANTRAPATIASDVPSAPMHESAPSLTDVDLPNITPHDLEPFDISSLPQRAERPVRGNVQGRAMQDTLMRATIPTANVFTTPQGSVTSALGQGSSLGLEGFADEIRNQTGQISQFVLEGDVRNRSVVTSIIPDYPENINKSSTVTLSFIVAENGSVQNITFIRRGEPEFDRVSEEALRQWRFNPADRTHSGQITFRFTLE